MRLQHADDLFHHAALHHRMRIVVGGLPVKRIPNLISVYVCSHLFTVQVGRKERVPSGEEIVTVSL